MKKKKRRSRFGLYTKIMLAEALLFLLWGCATRKAMTKLQCDLCRAAGKVEAMK